MPYARKRTRSFSRTRSRSLRARPLGTRRGAKKAVTKYRAKRFSKAVKGVVASTQETKRLSVVIANDQPINGGGLDHASTTATSAGYLVPNVMYSLDCVQGIASNQRVGDKIAPVSCYLRGMVHANVFDTVSNISFIPYDVHVVVFKHKASRDLPMGQLLMKYETSNNPPSAEPITGTPVNEMLPWSPSYSKIAHRVFRLRPPDSGDISGGSGTSQTRINTQTSNAPYYRRFAIKIPIPKKLTYETPTSQFPSNFWFSVGCYVVPSDGVALNGPSTPTLNQIRAKVYMRAQMSYKDA